MTSHRELIEHVKPHPEIWQLTHPLFKNKMVRLKFWHKLAKELNADEQQLRKNWKYLADQYRREYKKIKAQESAVGEPVACGWTYYEALSFLQPGVASRQERAAPRRLPSSESDNEPPQDAHPSYTTCQDNNDENFTQDNAWPFPSPVKKIKKVPIPSKADLILQKLQTIRSMMSTSSDAMKDDDDYLFFMSVLPTVRTLPLMKKLQLRGKINDWILEALSEREADPLNSAHYAMMEQEDNKQAVRNQIMEAEDD